MLDSSLKAVANRFVWLLQSASIVAAPKKAHYIGALKLGIALARVATLILAVEGYACAPQRRRAEALAWRPPRRQPSRGIPKTAQHAG
jgi:hypothetical protein